MRHIILFLLLCLTATQLSAETLKGKVVDAKTREPIVAANVFFDGTTIGTATGLNGEFSIVVRERIYSKLVISCLGYETVVIAEPFKSLPEVILMDEKEALLDEVEVTAKPVFSRAQKLAAFRKIFLGETVSASQCKILNEDEIKLIYNVEDRTFTAYSDVPLQIVNRHLKYKISWEMVLFKVQFDRDKSLKEQHAERISILGLAAFGDESHNDRTADLLPADYLPATDFEERNNRFIRPDIKQLIYSNEK